MGFINLKAGTHMQITYEPNGSRQACSKLIFHEPEANKGHPVLPSVPNSLCVHAKNWQISVCSKQDANHSQMGQRRFAVSCTHTRIWFACVYYGWQYLQISISISYRYFLHDDIDISIWHRYSPSIKNGLFSIFHEVHCYPCT